ncbi:MAG TPA: TRAP transporter small permease [Kofleriaceae bacterium]|nr:TRAP transporter small permease [Kofleriaceae bacterium]
MSDSSVEGTPGGEAPSRASRLSIDLKPPTFPDDSAASGIIRKVDGYIGIAEQIALFALLAAVVLTAAGAALSDKVLGDPFGRWWFTVVRGGTFTIAMLGAVFATHQQRHLAMDLVSRKIPPRGRLVLSIVLKLFTILIAYLLFKSGMHQRDHVGGTVKEFIDDKTIVTMMPLGAALIILHSVLHIIIDVDYLARGKLPPEKARTGH